MVLFGAVLAAFLFRSGHIPANANTGADSCNAQTRSARSGLLNHRIEQYPRKPLPHTEQIVRLKRLLRRTRTEVQHRYEDLFDSTRGRRECHLEVAVSCRLLGASQDAVSLLEACVEELERQEAMFYAPFKPGDRIVGVEGPPGRG